MGFGQYTEKHTRTGKYRGYPENKPLKTGRMTVEEITAGVNDSGLVSTVKSGHNEVTLTYDDGTIVCRLRETNIVTVSPNGAILIDTGGWNTPTTRRHIMNFLKAWGFQINAWGDKKGGGNRIFMPGKLPDAGICFNEWVVIKKGGGYSTDLGGAA